MDKAMSDLLLCKHIDNLPHDFDAASKMLLIHGWNACYEAMKKAEAERKCSGCKWYFNGCQLTTYETGEVVLPHCEVKYIDKDFCCKYWSSKDEK